MILCFDAKDIISRRQIVVVSDTSRTRRGPISIDSLQLEVVAHSSRCLIGERSVMELDLVVFGIHLDAWWIAEVLVIDSDFGDAQ